MTTFDPRGPAEVFAREHGCTVAEWLGWLPAAVGTHAMRRDAPDGACIEIGDGALELRWQALPPRVIALLHMPRLHVTYRFVRVSAAARAAFMRHFDLHLQRGGG